MRDHLLMSPDTVGSFQRTVRGQGLMRSAVALLVLCLVAPTAASSESCPGNPDALGTSRVLTISPTDFKRIGSMQYAQTLPLKDHEVVITFDDGPIPTLRQRYSRYTGLPARQGYLFFGRPDGAGLSVDCSAHLQRRPYHRHA